MRNCLLLLACLLSCLTAGRAQIVTGTILTGHQQVPSVASPAEHTVIMVISNDTLYVITQDSARLTSPIDEAVGAHIHFGFTGENGPVVLPLAFENIGTNNFGYARARLVDTFYVLRPTFRDSLTNAFTEGRAYINIHTRLFPGGEIRGQSYVLGNDDVFDAMLYGDQENPAVLTDGMGGIMIELNGNDITVSGAFQLESPALPVNGSPAHLHLGLVGENGPIAISLNPTLAADGLSGVFRRADNVFTLTDAQLDTMYARNLYANIHSVAHPMGEIRGQVVGYNSNLYFSHVSYDVTTPFPNPRARMHIMAEKPVRSNEIDFSGSYAGWGNEIADRSLRVFAQVGNALASANPNNPRNGAALTIVVPTLPSSVPGLGRIPYVRRAATAAQIDGLYQRYQPRAGFISPTNFIIYDSDFYHECKRAFYSNMTPSQELPSTISNAFGEFITEYYTSRIEVSGFATNLTDSILAGGMHIHGGMAGENGPVLAPIDFFNVMSRRAGVVYPTFSVYNLTPELATTMRERGFYINVHSRRYPAGEVRGQIVPRANVMYHAVVEPQQANPGGGPTEADGGVLIEATQSTMTASGSFHDLQGFDPSVAGGAHLHAGLPGVNGAIRYPLTTAAPAGVANGDFLPADNTFRNLSSAALDSLTARQFYVNIHSMAVPSGEIRGQVGPLATNVVASRLSPNHTVPYTGMLGMSRGTGRMVAELYDTTAILSGAFSELSSRIDTTIAGGAHMHGGTVGVTGPILFPIRFMLTANDTGAVAMPNMNVVALTRNRRDTLLNGNVYANVHTVNAPSGAIRGQMLLSENQYPDSVANFSSPINNSTIDINSGTASTVATIDWSDSDDPDAEQDVAYIWQLFVDTTLAPIVQTVANATSSTTFTFGQLDTLLLNLGVAEGASTTVYHQAWTSDGSLLTPSAYSAVTIIRKMIVSARELPAGAARLINTVGGRSGHTMFLDINELPAGRYTYEILSSTGQRLEQRSFDHSGNAQRYEVTGAPRSGGMYFLQLQDANGRSSGWGFVIQ